MGRRDTLVPFAARQECFAYYRMGRRDTLVPFAARQECLAATEWVGGTLLSRLLRDRSVSPTQKRAGLNSQSQEARIMAIGYDRPLYVLPFDHRATFSKNMFGWKGSLS